MFKCLKRWILSRAGVGKYLYLLPVKSGLFAFCCWRRSLIKKNRSHGCKGSLCDGIMYLFYWICFRCIGAGINNHISEEYDEVVLLLQFRRLAVMVRSDSN